ncbi:hypothetical protein L3476_22015 [Paenibacillus thiaminolyticus]|uniref:hypothetical protein n=1 Tax=Paenibacillus thiaminolyticus TaxID=49283 RepID=UPI00116231E2|nr:hypothetical protein [Paenibacillus thiaminolyticus]NGP60420.1 hypothetical protein [Paenibacillus thiaminolyticus]WCR25942.1 hypothetical protein L3476_22015 [Paenibacillus thiaminolyticus]
MYLKRENNTGEPDKDEFAGQVMYATYQKRHIVFAVDGSCLTRLTAAGHAFDLFGSLSLVP